MQYKSDVGRFNSRSHMQMGKEKHMQIQKTDCVWCGDSQTDESF